MAEVGLHLRITETMKELIEKAIQLELPFFQSFLINQTNKAYITCTKELLSFCSTVDCFSKRFAHSSYFINLASNYKQKILKREIELAKRLLFTHIVFHPGAVTDNVEREVALCRVAKTLNAMCKSQKDITIILENSAHGQKSLGGPLEELAFIKERLELPERVEFCLDTAHAYVFGYNLVDDINDSADVKTNSGYFAQENNGYNKTINKSFEQYRGHKNFIKKAIDLLGQHSITLIHLNDTKEQLGSCIDRHCTLGEGNLGKETLKKIVQNPLLQHAEIILELPQLNQEKEIEILRKTRMWLRKRDI